MELKSRSGRGVFVVGGYCMYCLVYFPLECYAAGMTTAALAAY